MVEKSSSSELGKRASKLARSVARRAHRAGEQSRIGRVDLALATLETIHQDIDELRIAARGDC